LVGTTVSGEDIFVVTIEELRRVLGTDVAASDDDLRFLLLHLYGIARLALQQTEIPATVVKREKETLCPGPSFTFESRPPIKSTTTRLKHKNPSAPNTVSGKASK
jgi:hypothetical protein